MDSSQVRWWSVTCDRLPARPNTTNRSSCMYDALICLVQHDKFTIPTRAFSCFNEMALLPTVSALSGPIQTVFSKSIIPEYQSALCLPHIGVAFALPSPCGHNHRFYFLVRRKVRPETLNTHTNSPSYL